MAKRQHIQFDLMMDYVSLCNREIRRCEKSKAYLAGCVLIGSSMEYLITATMRLFPRDVYKRGHRITGYWKLVDLNNLAKDCGWFDSFAFDAAERIRNTRNVLHPAWVAKSKALPVKASLFHSRSSDFDLIRGQLETLVIG